MSTEIVKPEESPDIETMQRADLPAIWDGYRTQLEKLKATAETLTVTDVSQTSEMKLARVTRLTLKDLRVEIEKRRKELGEEYLRKTQKINAAAKELRELIEPLEERLLEQEKFAEIAEAKRKAELKASREAALLPFGVNISFYNLSEMTEEAFSDLLATTKRTHEEKIEAERKAEEERIAKEKAEAEERERIRMENERLKREAAEREAALAEERKKAEATRLAAEEKARKEREALEAKAKAEREEAARKAAEAQAKAKAERDAIEAKARAERESAEAAAKKEREAREKIESELREKAAEEERKRNAQIAAEKKAAAAPDKEKIMAFAANVRSMSAPKCSTEDGAAVSREIADKIAKFATWIEAQANTL